MTVVIFSFRVIYTVPMMKSSVVLLVFCCSLLTISSKVQSITMLKLPPSGKRTFRDTPFSRINSPENKRTLDQYRGRQLEGYRFQDEYQDEERRKHLNYIIEVTLT